MDVEKFLSTYNNDDIPYNKLMSLYGISALREGKVNYYVGESTPERIARLERMSGTKYIKVTQEERDKIDKRMWG